MIRRTVVMAVALTVVAIAVGGAYLIWPTEKSPLRVTAHFDNAVGLYEGNTVAVLGMPVGRVLSIKPGGDHVNVELEIDPGIDLPAGVQAVTVGTSILTDRHVELTPPYDGGPKLAHGDVLSIESTRTPIEFDRVLKMVDTLGTAMGGDGHGGGPLADITAATSDITSTSGQQIKTALASLSDALRSGADGGAATKANIDTVVTELSRLTDAAARNEGQVREFGTYVRQVSDILAENNVGGGDTGRKLNELLGQINGLLDTNEDHLKATVGSTARMSRALVDYRRELAEVFDVAPLAIDNVSNAIDMDNGMLRVGAHFDSVFFDSSMTKEVCNILGLRQLGCRTGTITDLGPDFGVTSVLEGMTRLAE
ncbi:MCE family protein [Mycolicibacterium confluentis]|uniref:Putative Mce family protein n=1 Tax=Mycolicibacterium confluentis TaxID=28047 RepID=A0A7I7Y1P8_9MYCO|nr:MCE family protein [Mycolicibacterium confluentis]BBZ35103.1 putative Mce family protein [Mycolicibacterium confluentis]